MTLRVSQMTGVRNGYVIMLKTLANTMLIGAVQKGTGVPPTSTLTTALLTTGASLLLARGRRPIGVALLAVGGLLLWHEREEAAKERLKPAEPSPVPSGGVAG